MKKHLAIILACILLLSLFACAGKTEQSNIEESSTSSINFNLSQYDSYGELSCGRIWVKKLESSWDSSPTKYFAYLDANGNVIYGWKAVGAYQTADYWGVYDAEILYPQNYVNNFAYIINTSGDYQHGVTIIDLYGNTLYENVNIRVNFHHSTEGLKHHITDFDEEGYAYFIGYAVYDQITEGDFGLYWIDHTGVHKFQDDLSLSYGALSEIERIDSHFFFHWAGQSILFNSYGRVVIDFNESANISPYKIELLENNQIKVFFEGKDTKNYQCVIDYEGNFLTEPTKVE